MVSFAFIINSGLIKHSFVGPSPTRVYQKAAPSGLREFHLYEILMNIHVKSRLAGESLKCTENRNFIVSYSLAISEIIYYWLDLDKLLI